MRCSSRWHNRSVAQFSLFVWQRFEVESVLRRKEVIEMAIGECGVCGRWCSGTSVTSGNKRRDGITPMDNFVCFRCQEEARDLREVAAGCERQGRSRKAA
jgi:hypothetical protein